MNSSLWTRQETLLGDYSFMTHRVFVTFLPRIRPLLSHVPSWGLPFLQILGVLKYPCHKVHPGFWSSPMTPVPRPGHWVSWSGGPEWFLIPQSSLCICPESWSVTPGYRVLTSPKGETHRGTSWGSWNRVGVPLLYGCQYGLHFEGQSDRRTPKI